MSRFVDHSKMTAAEVARCCIQARAIISMCERSVWAYVENGSDPLKISIAAEVIQLALKLAHDLLEPVQDALGSHERALEDDE